VIIINKQSDKEMSLC